METNIHICDCGRGYGETKSPSSCKSPRTRKGVIVLHCETCSSMPTSLNIFLDNSSIEIFINYGEEVFTTRIYNHYGRLLINGECSGIMTVYPLKSFEIEGGRNEE